MEYSTDRGVDTSGEWEQSATERPSVVDKPAAQVEAEKSVEIELGTGVSVRVPLQAEWRKSALDALQVGDFDGWAESVFSPEDHVLWVEWMDTDPIMGDLNEFFDRLGKATGAAAGGNRALRRSLQRTQRR